MEHKKISWKAESLIYKGSKRIAVYFENTPELEKSSGMHDGAAH